MTSSNSTQDKDKLRPLTVDECHLRYNIEQETPDLYCGAIWDGFYCWPPAPPGQIVSKTCDSIFASYQLLVYSDSADQEHAYRICRDDGTWLWGNWTNYTECLGLLSSGTTKNPTAVGHILFIGSIISLLVLMVTLFIFSYFNDLRLIPEKRNV